MRKLIDSNFKIDVRIETKEFVRFTENLVKTVIWFFVKRTLQGVKNLF